MGYENRLNPVGRRESDFELAAMKVQVQTLVSQVAALRLRVAQQQTEIDELQRTTHVLAEHIL